MLRKMLLSEVMPSNQNQQSQMGLSLSVFQKCMQTVAHTQVYMSHVHALNLISKNKISLCYQH